MEFVIQTSGQDSIWEEEFSYSNFEDAVSVLPLDVPAYGFCNLVGLSKVLKWLILKLALTISVCFTNL